MHLTRIFDRTFQFSDWTQNPIDSDGLKYLSRILVWARWALALMCFFMLVYRPIFPLPSYAVFASLLLVMVAFNGYIHYRLLNTGDFSWLCVLSVSALDLILITVAIVVSGFNYFPFYLMYFLSLGLLALISPSVKFNLCCVALVSAVYALVSVGFGEGIDFELREDKTLIGRIVIMCVFLVAINLVSQFERVRWREAVNRERTLQRERIELSHSIHDTMAQSAYMIGLGLDRLRKLNDSPDGEQAEILNALTSLSKSAMWDLRHPIDMGHIFEGRELSRTLASHVETFTAITSVPAEMTQCGAEPPISTEVKGLLFSIAHNALTNAYRHAKSAKVLIAVDFKENELRLSVSDDGTGLPDDYQTRGHGFENMRTDAARMGGELVISSNNEPTGTTVTCIVPYAVEHAKV